jgi:hypothetical protein
LVKVTRVRAAAHASPEESVPQQAVMSQVKSRRRHGQPHPQQRLEAPLRGRHAETLQHARRRAARK